MFKIPKAPLSRIPSKELAEFFKSSGCVESFYFPPEVPHPPSCFQQEEREELVSESTG